MRFKLIKLFQTAESLSGLILKHSSNTGQPDGKDQLKLQRNIRQYVIGYLKENSFSLSPLPAKDVYLKLKAQRQVYLQEEMNRAEMEQSKQLKQINEEVNRRQINTVKKPRPYVSIDNSNGWVSNVKGSLLIEAAEDPNSSTNTIENEQNKALKIQIQLVEGYLEDALRQNKRDEASLLQKNLNELLNMLVGSS